MIKQTFLVAEWRNLLMANYKIDPAILKEYVPAYTELDAFQGNHLISLVAFLFKDTKVQGIRFPFHHTFEEVNLRFYVRYKSGSEWKRGVVFIKEIVPKQMISFVANTIYKEKYATHPMRHQWLQTEKELMVSYEWKVQRQWNHLNAIAEKEPQTILTGSEEEFITEHYWGYTKVSPIITGEYEVNHPKWRVHPVKSYMIKCDTKALYGAAFEETLSQKPHSVFLAEGSQIKVMQGNKVLIRSFTGR